MEELGIKDVVDRFEQLNEYTFYDSSVVEDEDNDIQPSQSDGGMDAQGDAQPNQMPQGQTDGGENGVPDLMQTMQGGDGQDAVGGGQQAPMADGGAQPPMDVPTGQEVETGADAAQNNDDGIEDIEMEGDDEVVDVDDLTKSQETTEYKVDHLDDRLSKVIKVIDKFADGLEAINNKIDNLKTDFDKRNPSQEEQINLRTMASAPYDQTPKGYWEKQQKEHPNYNVISDNDVSTADEQKKFDITRGDIENFNERDVARSFDEDNDMMKLSSFVNF